MASRDWSSRPEVDLRYSPHSPLQRIHLRDANSDAVYTVDEMSGVAAVTSMKEVTSEQLSITS